MERRHFLRSLGIGAAALSIPAIGLSKRNETGNFLIYHFHVFCNDFNCSYIPKGKKDLLKIHNLINVIKKESNVKSSFSPVSSHFLPKGYDEHVVMFYPELFRNNNIDVEKNSWAGCLYSNKKIARNFAAIYFSSHDEIRDYYYSGDLMKYRTNWEVWKDIFYVWNVDNGTLIPLVDVL
ncbi:MAG TPA: hypothetical protein VMX17_05955 [Candidatus Glassbacteria bacterium]|nr:hypothetical protein [Candidatus Glassbacteria bacterium]